MGQGKKILVLEPRRLAARAAAARMAATLGEAVGATVGYRVRFGSKVSRATRIELVTEGVFTRLILDDPALAGVAAVLLDEFHERSLDADLGLALARDVQQGLREDLKLLVMSATLDGARVGKLLGGAPVIESLGRAFPVETRYLGRDARAPIEPQVADAVMRALRGEAGSLLVFLPGAAEIRRTETLLRERVSDPSIDIVALYGALEADVQDRAIAPAPPGRRKVVLATAIAETSLTIEGVRVVIDCGLARVPRYEPDVGLTRLETVRVSRASADQRRGRAGRTQPGICYRLWDEPQTAALERRQPAGNPRRRSVRLRARPRPLGRRRSRLARLPRSAAGAGARRGQGAARRARRHRRRRAHHRRRPTAAQSAAAAASRPHGDRRGGGRRGRACRRDRRRPHRARSRRHRRRSRPPSRRAAPGSFAAGRGCASDGEEMGAGCKCDLLPRKRSAPSPLAGEGWGGGSFGDATLAPPADIRTTPTPGPSPQGGGESRAGVGRRTEQQPSGGEKQPLSVGALVALAYPDRVAKNRGAGGAFLLANGRGAHVDETSPLARAPFLAVAEITGTAAQGRIVLAAPLTLDEIEAQFADRIESRDEIAFDDASASLRARRLRRLGAIALAEQPLQIVPDEETARMLAQGIARLGIDRLPWTKSLRQWRDRVMFLRDRSRARDRHEVSKSATPTWKAGCPISPMPR